VHAGEQFVALDYERSGAESSGIYLVQKWAKVAKTDEEKAADEAESAAVTEEAAAAGRLVIGAADEGKTEKSHALLLMPEKVVVPLEEGAELPAFVQSAVDAVIAHTGVALKDQTAAFVDDFEAKESKFARTLEQLPVDPSKKIPSDPKEWKCMESGATENLWLNLSTGFIGSGRRNWDGTGGNGAAERHYEATGSKYPLCVKLGTITKDGADIYSYDKSEQDMVLDPLLAQHLEYWVGPP
jgi:ubiquitin carboxyl-terminal hydrolase 5/13